MSKTLERATALHAAVEGVLRHLARSSDGLRREEILAAALVRVEGYAEATQERYLTGGQVPVGP